MTTYLYNYGCHGNQLNTMDVVMLTWKYKESSFYVQNIVNANQMNCIELSKREGFNWTPSPSIRVT